MIVLYHDEVEICNPWEADLTNTNWICTIIKLEIFLQNFALNTVQFALLQSLMQIWLKMTKFDENDFIYRTQSSYNFECKQIEEAPNNTAKNNLSTLYGLNCRSILADLSSFDITKMLPQDIMHTILEGVLQYESKLILK